mgnify:CR=1 FL=1
MRRFDLLLWLLLLVSLGFVLWQWDHDTGTVRGYLASAKNWYLKSQSAVESHQIRPSTAKTMPAEQERSLLITGQKLLDESRQQVSVLRSRLEESDSKLSAANRELAVANRQREEERSRADDLALQLERLQQQQTSRELAAAAAEKQQSFDVARLEIELEKARLALSDSVLERGQLASSLEASQQEAAVLRKRAESRLLVTPAVHQTVDVSNYQDRVRRLSWENDVLKAKLAKQEFAIESAGRALKDRDRQIDEWSRSNAKLVDELAKR